MFSVFFFALEPKGSALNMVVIAAAVSSVIVSAIALTAALRWRCRLMKGQQFNTRPGGLPQWSYLSNWSPTLEAGKQGNVMF